MGTVTIRWRDRSIEETEQRIYRSTEPFSSDNLPPIHDTVAPDVEEYKDSTVEEDSTYYYMISSYRASPELEVFGDLLTVDTSFSLGPGPSNLVDGTATMGVFNGISAADFITGSTLADRIGLTAGTAHNNTSGWFKFVLDGKILYVPQYSLRHSVSWNHINDVGAVYGEQVIEISGYQFKVRLLTGADEDPVVDVSLGNDPEGTRNSEWTRLFAPIMAVNRFVSYSGPRYASHNDAYFGATSASGRAFWTQNVTNDGLASFRAGSTDYRMDYFNATTPGSVATVYGWRPCLELVV